MSKNYDLIATVDIDIASPLVDDASFDHLLIFGPAPAVAPETAPAAVGVYSSIDEVTDAGWVASGNNADPVGVAAKVAFSQSPRPAQIYIAVQQELDVESVWAASTAVAVGRLIVANNVVFKCTTAGTTDATEPEWPESGTVTDGTAVWTFVGDAALEDPTTTIARAIPTSGWYVACSAGIPESQYEDIAAYIETQEKMFCYTEMSFFGVGLEGTNDPAVGNVYYRTMGIYGRESKTQIDADVPAANKYMNVAWVAKWLNYESGSETAAFKVLSSVYPSTLTSIEMKAITDANLNYFTTVGNKNISMNGKTMAGEWADIIRFRDWLKNDMQVRVVNLFIVNPKIPYTDSGIALVQSQMLASLKSGQDVGGIAEEEFDADGNSIPGYSTSVPLSSSLTSSEKASRKLTKCKFKARLAGAIHFAEITGSLTYEL